MIRLTLNVYWNNLKGGIDVISNYMRTISRTNVSENPIVSIVGRLLSTQVNNAAVAYRLSIARRQGNLPKSGERAKLWQKGYGNLRDRISQCLTFGLFARSLAKE